MANRNANLSGGLLITDHRFISAMFAVFSFFPHLQALKWPPILPGETNFPAGKNLPAGGKFKAARLRLHRDLRLLAGT
jgi:hypothetical protein